MLASNDGKSKDDASTDIEPVKRIGLTIFFLVFGVFGLWAAFAPLDGAALAPGLVTVKSYKKIVQHLEGGIVRDIYAVDGDIVKAGQELLKLDDTEPLALLEMGITQFNANSAKEARLLAEQSRSPSITFPPDWEALDPAFAGEMIAQTAVFNSRKTALQGQQKVLEQRIEQLKSKLVGITALKESKENLAKSYSEELEDVMALLGQGFSDKARLRNVERSLSLYEGEAADLLATISSIQLQIGETELEILRLDQQMQSEVTSELAEVQTLIRDLSERLLALRDVVSRTSVKAPDSGVVNGMQVHTIGGVIAAGSPIAEIVPVSEELILEARLSALDVDRVAPNQEATIRFSSFGSKAPTVFGSVLNLSADAIIDQVNGQPYYLARIEVDSESLSTLGELQLLPGMPAEVFIATGSRTLLEYMFKPLSNTIARSFIED
jgi:epimerase transport system membrane fusion protein